LPHYAITGTGNAQDGFTVTFAGILLETNASIETIMDAVRNHAKGADIEIQFGDGNTWLDLGDASGIEFSNEDVDIYENKPFWRNILLTGKVTSKLGGSNPTITIGKGVSVESRADVHNGIWNEGNLLITGGEITSARTGFLYNSGNAEITGGTFTINEENSYGIFNGGGESEKGVMLITGGTFTTTGEYSISVYNDYEGAMQITGGNFIAEGEGSFAMQNRGKVEITGGTFTVTGDGDYYFDYWTNTYMPGDPSAAIYSYRKGSTKIKGGTFIAEGKHSSAVLVDRSFMLITGGTFTSTANNSYAIYIDYDSTVEISGGAFTATGADSVALFNNNSNGVTVVKGGTFTATGSNNYAVYAMDESSPWWQPSYTLHIRTPPAKISGAVNAPGKVIWN
jgi:hypothetical protein